MSKKTWRMEWVLLFCGAQFLCVALGQIGIAILYKLKIAGFRQPDDFGNIVLATLSFQGVTWILIPIFLRLHQVRWREMFWGSAKGVIVSLALAAGTLFVILPVALILQYLSVLVMEHFHWLPQEQTAVKLLMSVPLWPTGVYLGFFAVVLAPVAEEFIFRGVLFPFIKKLGYPALAWVGVSLLFALIHADAAIFVPLFVLALALTWLYEKTDSLLASITVHSMFNATNLAVFFIAKQHGAV